MSQPAPTPHSHGRHRTPGPARVLSARAAPVGRLARWLVVLSATLLVTAGASAQTPSSPVTPPQQMTSRPSGGVADRVSADRVSADPITAHRIPVIAPGPVLVLPHQVSTTAPTADHEAGLAALEQAILSAEALTASRPGSPLTRRPDAGPWPNGDLPEAALCVPETAPEALLRCDAAAALDRLNLAYRLEHGVDLTVVSAYRDLASQVAVKQVRGWLAAAPGTSQHGLGVAVDLGGVGGLGQYDSAQYLWLTRNAGSYGWYHPRAMQPGGGGPPEPWHWEFSAP